MLLGSQLLTLGARRALLGFRCVPIRLELADLREVASLLCFMPARVERCLLAPVHRERDYCEEGDDYDRDDDPDACAHTPEVPKTVRVETRASFTPDVYVRTPRGIRPVNVKWNAQNPYPKERRTVVVR